MKSSKLFIIALLAVVLYSCGKREVYNSFVTMPASGWNQDSLVVFRVDIEDVSMPYNLFVQIRNDNMYPNSNLWLFIDVVSPDGNLQRDTLECMLTDINGRWLGSGWGSLYSMKHPYRLGAKFGASGTYTFRVMHGMRQEDIAGIQNIGLVVDKSE